MYNNLISSNYSKIILSYILLCGFNLNLFKHLHRIKIFVCLVVLAKLIYC